MVDIYFAGIGSRETPDEIGQQQRVVAKKLAAYGLILRSGGADGADTNFEEAYLSVHGKMEIWLPWMGFNGRTYEKYLPKPLHYALAMTLHPAWTRLTRGPQALHARNTGQVLGDDLKTPVAFVLCWTKDGARNEAEVTRNTGGTGTAIRLASRMNIPVINMYHTDWLQQLKNVLASIDGLKSSTSAPTHKDDTTHT